MKSIKVFHRFFIFLLIYSMSATASDKQLDAVANMGELNGIALHCRYLDEVKQIKSILIRTLPQQRKYGEVFERTTNDSFMQVMKEKTKCPTQEFLKQQISLGQIKLESVFKH